MAFRHSDSILSGSSDDFIDSRSKSLRHRHPYIHDYLRQTDSVNHHAEFIPYSKHERRRQERNAISREIMERILNTERSRRSLKDVMSQYTDIPSQDELIHSKLRRSRSARICTDQSLSSSRRSRITPVAYQSSSRLQSQRDRYYRPAPDVYQACQVIMIYEKDSSSSSQNDEIIVKQQQNEEGQTIIVYKGYLKKGDTFSFKSQHHAQYPFHVKFYVNGHVDGHASVCCEYKYRQGGFLLSRSFTIEHVAKCIPCQRCQRREEKNNRENIPSDSSSDSVRLTDHEDPKERKRTLSDNRSSKNRNNIKSEEKNSSEDEQNNHVQLTDQNQSDHGIRKSKMIVSSSEIQSTQSQQEKPSNTNESNESENNFASRFRRTLMERTTNGNNDSGGLFQSLLTLLQNGFRRTEPREPLPARYEGNVEDFLVILLGIKDKSNVIHSIVNLIKIFDDIEQFNSFIEHLTFEKILLIVDDSLAESIEDPSRFHSIYLLASNVSWANNHSNVRGIYPNLLTIYEQIKKECSKTNDFISLQSISADETTNQLFSYSQLLKETLLTQDYEANLKKDLIDYCRFHYADNQIQLDFIEELEGDFTVEKSIWWYTRNTFLRKMLNRALRTEEIDILYKMRWFIQALNTQIKQTNLSQIVYRLHHVSSDEFEQMKSHGTGGLLSFGTFLDCTLNKPSFIEHIDQMETLIFTIETTVGIEIERLRYSDSKIEILFPLDTVFCIESIEKDDQDYWNITLRSVPKDNSQLKQITNEMREEISGPAVLIQLGKLLLCNDDYSHADYFARLLFNDNSLKGNPTLLASLAAVHHLLGSVDHRRNNHRAARLQFEQSLEIFLTFIPSDNQILSATYNNIGSMHYQEDEHEQAINYHQKALQCQLKSTSPDIDAIATYSGNIGAVYLDQAKYDQALSHYKRSLQILEQSIPGGESKAIAMVNDRIASVYWKMDKPTEALTFYQRALQLELKYLPENDHKISVSYFNLSTAYAKLNRLDDAIEYAEKSVQQLLKSVSPDHPEVKENTEQLEGLRRKKWLQQLYE